QLASRAAERSSWPSHRGFQRFYGFLAAETSYFKPGHLVEGDEFVDRDDYPEGYYTTDEWTDRAIVYVKEHLAASPDRPFFLYLAENAPHMPLQVKPEHRGAYRGYYDSGWDSVREERFARQLRMGVIDGRHRIPPHTPGVPEWEALSTEERRVCARYMELYASVVEAIDSNLRRLVDFLDAAGALSNTLILVTSDNGANAVGGPYGNPNQFAARYGLSLRHDDPRVVAMVDEDRMGDAETAPAYPTGWAETSNTPFRMFKRTTMNGGIRVPLVASWPDGIGQPGATRGDWVHVTDVAPTILDVAGVSYPDIHRGHSTRPVDGASFARLLTEPAAAAHRRPRQHYELQANRGMIDGDWKIVTLQPPHAEMDLDHWMLFNQATDPSETEDLATKEPGILARLMTAFDQDAKANWVYPLDNRGARRNVAIAPPLVGVANQARFFHAGTPTVGVAVVGALVADRDYRLRARFDYEAGDEGVVFALGDAMSGFSLYVLDGTLRFGVARWPEPASVVATPAPAGPVSFEMLHAAS
ncbi:MAG: sulfatase-like hydrolase/transferase, partial [Acidimicrobiales bacterium]